MRALRPPYRAPIKFYMSISNRPITITRGDNLMSISFLCRIYGNVVTKYYFTRNKFSIIFSISDTTPRVKKIVYSPYRTLLHVTLGLFFL